MQGANVNARDKDGRVPLHHCAANGHERCAKLLIWQTPDTIKIDAIDNFGDSALHLASQWGFVGIVKELLQSSAKREQKNVKGLTPLDVANSTVIQHLFSHDKRVFERASSPRGMFSESPAKPKNVSTGRATEGQLLSSIAITTTVQPQTLSYTALCQT